MLTAVIPIGKLDTRADPFRSSADTIRASVRLRRHAILRRDFPSMKALSILGSGSGAGKSWITTALGAWLHGQGIRVAPFKAQNMSNNAWVTLDGGEIGRAQAVQGGGLRSDPTVQMNPILLKPSGARGSQVIVLGPLARSLCRGRVLSALRSAMADRHGGPRRLARAMRCLADGRRGQSCGT